MWTSNAALVPDGYSDYRLCKNVYHCTPDELAAQDAEIVARDLAFYNAEVQHDNAVRKMQTGQAGAKQ